MTSKGKLPDDDRCPEARSESCWSAQLLAFLGERAQAFAPRLTVASLAIAQSSMTFVSAWTSLLVEGAVPVRTSDDGTRPAVIALTGNGYACRVGNAQRKHHLAATMAVRTRT